MNFILPVKVKLHTENCISVKNEFTQRYSFSTTFWILREDSFGRTSFDDSICMSWLINVNTARFLEKTETLGHNEKAQIHRLLKNSNSTLNVV